MTQVLIGVRHRLHHEGVRAAHRLLVPDEDLAVGELVRVGRGRRDAEHLADLLGQLRKAPAGEEHQALAVLGDDAAHRLVCSRLSAVPDRSWCRDYSVAVSPAAGCAGHRARLAPWIASRRLRRRLARRALAARCARLRAAAPCRAACAATQPSMLRCGARATPSAPGGTSLVITLPAAV